MSYTKVKINNHKRNKIPNYGDKPDKRPVPGSHLVADPYGIVALVGRREVGKSSTLMEILLETLTKFTTVFIFAHTVKEDKNWINIRRWMTEKGIVHHIFTEIGGNLQPIVAELMKRSDDEEAERNAKMSGAGNFVSTYIEKHNQPGILLNNDEEEEDPGIQYKFDIPNHIKRAKSKYLVPDCLFVFDDISDELRTPPVIRLLKENRHWKTRVIVSSQAVFDLYPSSRRMTTLWLVFRGELGKLPDIHKDGQVKLPYDVFEEMYLEATDVVRLKYKKGDKERTLYEFFYVDQDNRDYRIGFSTQLKPDVNVVEER